LSGTSTLLLTIKRCKSVLHKMQTVLLVIKHHLHGTGYCWFVLPLLFY